MNLLAIETSCDDTAAAVLSGGVVRANVVSSQLDHRRFGGVVPELASRAHQRFIVPVVKAALETAGLTVDEIDVVAATRGPGLAGSLLVGLSFAKAFAAARRIPFVGVNHIEAHILSPFIEEPGAPPYPFLALVVSGGHTELLLVESLRVRSRLGRTRDDAAGEAFDKVAKIFGLGYPGGPAIEAAAREGDPAFVGFPRARLDGYDFSFSGIKTSVLYHLKAVAEPDRARYLERHLQDLAASFQQAMIDMILSPLERALADTRLDSVSLSGGVSSNAPLRAAAGTVCNDAGARLHVAPPALRTDNAAMVGLVAYHLHRSGYTSPLSTAIDPAAALV